MGSRKTKTISVDTHCKWPPRLISGSVKDVSYLLIVCKVSANFAESCPFISKGVVLWCYANLGVSPLQFESGFFPYNLSLRVCVSC